MGRPEPIDLSKSLDTLFDCMRLENSRCGKCLLFVLLETGEKGHLQQNRVNFEKD